MFNKPRKIKTNSESLTPGNPALHQDSIYFPARISFARRLISDKSITISFHPYQSV